ncbi:hypothetical protein TMPK1_27350 [Rhodospirillales bacterium TMPK1]|uniref:Uncharacterized protein n=2 Tax=Roseiterribacter gracilis TaxID=2812848 RepID=A0A8S8X933_9PROT|nr:hypothetical protein TMPK1_27350 [Rhodospirillales bacterium TMPK1]
MSLGGFGSYGGLGQMDVFGAVVPINVPSKIVTPSQAPAQDEHVEEDSKSS